MLAAALAVCAAVDWSLALRRVWVGVGLPALGAGFFFFLFLHVAPSQARANRLWNAVFLSPRYGVYSRLAGMAFAASLLLTLTPSFRLGRLEAYHEIILPFLAALVVSSGVASAIILIHAHGFHGATLKEYARVNRRAWLLTLAALAGMLSVWLFIALTGRGIQSAEDYWFGAGTPLLFQQLLLGLLLAFLFSKFEERLLAWVGRLTRSRISPDALLFLLIWAFTAILWAHLPAPAGFMALRPQPPNFDLYPFADSLRYDLGSQFALIGQGLNDGRFYYRVFYVAYLFVMHSLFGQHYERVMTAQAVLFAIFPALVYLLGRNLKSRPLGVLTAVIAASLGFNSILASLSADVANPKQMLTDFPTAIGVAAVTLLLVQWWRNPSRVSMLFWAAGALGVASLVRTSALGLLAVLLLVIWLAVPRAWGRKILLSAFALLIFLASAFPWSARYGRNVTDMYAVKFKSVLLRRYNDVPNPAIELPPPTIVPRASPAVAVPDHFVHNLVMSALILPPSPILYDLRTVIRQEFPYWDVDWDGHLDFVSSLWIAINLLVLALGIGASLRDLGRGGFIPLLMFAAFCGINSLGRTSGGRYSAPMDWILPLYYAWGVLFIWQTMRAMFAPVSGSAEEAAAAESPAVNFSFRNLSRRAVPVFLILFSVSALLILWSSLVPQRYADATEEELFQQFVDSGYAAKTHFPTAALREFLQEEQAVILNGRALYPRYYLANQGVGILWKAFAEESYPRLLFSLVGPQGDEFVILPGPSPKVFPNAADVTVLGCKAENAIVAVVVVVQTPIPHIYTVPSSVILTCPLTVQEQ